MTTALAPAPAKTPVLLDHRGRALNPPRSPQRIRALRAKYDSAQTSTDNANHWANADGLSPAAAHSPDVRLTLRTRARYEVYNNSYAVGIVRTLANDVIGTGPRLQLTPPQGSELDPELAQDLARIERAWHAWAEEVRLADKLRTMRIAKCVDGEAFGLLQTNYRLRSAVKLDLKLYEADQVARPWVALDDPLMTDGIVLDDYGNPAAYTILKQHPGDWGTIGAAGEHETFPAGQVIHLFRRERPGQVRGVPEITSALPLFAQLRRFTLSVIAAAEVAADLSGLLKTQGPPEDPDDLEPLEAIEFERRMLMTLPRGWDVHQMKAEQPSTTYAMFKSEILAEIARCISVPFNVAAGTSANMNYSSGRLDHRLYEKAITVDRSDLDREAIGRLVDAWWREASLVGLIPERVQALAERPSRCIRWDGFEHIDPQKEASAQQTRLANHTTTLAREYARAGLDWEVELRQRAAELKLMGELGVPLSLLNPPAAEQAPPERPDDEESEE